MEENEKNQEDKLRIRGELCHRNKKEEKELIVIWTFSDSNLI